MDKNEVNETLGMQTNVFRQKADKILSAIRVINGQGGLATQFMMVTVCIDVQKFLFFLQEITHSEERDKRLIGINLQLSDIDKYIRSFKDAQHDLIRSGDLKQREKELNLIKNLKKRISDGNEFYDLQQDVCDNLDSWAGLKTDIPTLWKIIYDTIRNIINELDNIYYIAKTENPMGMALW